MQDFRKIKAWEKAHAAALVTYRLTASFPAAERYGLTQQMRRAAASVAANIAEGCGRGSDADFARFLQMAMGSASELEYFLLLARDLMLVGPSDLDRAVSHIQEVKRMHSALISRLRSDS